MIDEKRAFRKIMREWGHDVYLQRRLDNGNYANKFERVTTRHVGQSGMSNMDSRSIKEEGIDIDFDAMYYFEAEVKPREGDRIYENYSVKVSKNHTILIVAAVTPTRGRQGKILFWTAGANREC
jgi:hypothetical protein